MSNDSTVSRPCESETSLGTYLVFPRQQDWPPVNQYLAEVTHDERPGRGCPPTHERRRQGGLPFSVRRGTGEGSTGHVLAP
jgi:hypothetical protein